MNDKFSSNPSQRLIHGNFDIKLILNEYKRIGGGQSGFELEELVNIAVFPFINDLMKNTKIHMKFDDIKQLYINVFTDLSERPAVKEIDLFIRLAFKETVMFKKQTLESRPEQVNLHWKLF